MKDEKTFAMHHAVLDGVIKLMDKHNIDLYLVSSRDEFNSEYAPLHNRRLEAVSDFSGSFGICLITKKWGILYTDGRYTLQAAREVDTEYFTVRNIVDLRQDIQAIKTNTYSNQSDSKCNSRDTKCDDNTTTMCGWIKQVLGSICNFFNQKACGQKNTSNKPSISYKLQGINLISLGYDPKIFGKAFLKNFEGLKLVSIEENLIDLAWENRPEISISQFYAYDSQYSGVSTQQKLQQLRGKGEHYLDWAYETHKDAKADSVTHRLPKNIYFVSTDSPWICWLLNIRGNDLEHTPIVLSHLIVQYHETDPKPHITLYTNAICANIEQIEYEIQLKPLEAFYEDLQSINHRYEHEGFNSLVYLEQGVNNDLMHKILSKCNITEYNANILRLWQSCKNETELSWIRKGHIDDAVALMEAFAWLDEEVGRGSKITEYEFGHKLAEFRKNQTNYVCESFNPICGLNSNGAIVHYRADKNDCQTLDSGLLLVDSGGQYYGCTTDVTRVLCVNNFCPTNEQKELYTRVLIGHIDLVLTKFDGVKVPKPISAQGEPGLKIDQDWLSNCDTTMFARLDSTARASLKSIGQNYAHGTGHGVGSFLGVHEAPISVSQQSKIPMLPNMVFSNEPGVYLEGKFGIRIENLIVSRFTKNVAPSSNVNDSEQPDEGVMHFENLTMIPYCADLIDWNLLNDEHKNYINDYYAQIKLMTASRLSPLAQKWLDKHTTTSNPSS